MSGGRWATLNTWLASTDDLLTESATLTGSAQHLLSGTAAEVIVDEARAKDQRRRSARAGSRDT